MRVERSNLLPFIELALAAASVESRVIRLELQTCGGFSCSHPALFLAIRAATQCFENLSSWPMRFQQQSPRATSESARSTDSGSAQDSLSHLESDSPPSVTDSSHHHRLRREIAAASGASCAATIRNLQLSAQEKLNKETRKMISSTPAKEGKPVDPKIQRRLAQNREAAKKSRIRKKAYVQQLETSRIKLQLLEHDIQRARSQGLFLGVAGCSNGAINSAAVMFDLDYSRWLDENNKHMANLQSALQAHLPDGNLIVLVDQCITHYDGLFRLKAIVAKSDVLHILNGSWKTPAERSFLWMGGFRPSELLGILIRQLEPLTEQQLVGMHNLQHSSQQAESALSQGFVQLHRALAEAVAGNSIISDVVDGVGNLMGYMAVAVKKLSDLEGFVSQADNLRRQTFQELRQILTVRQAARCFLAIGEYYTRLRTLSSLWASQPREVLANDCGGPTTSDLQIVHQPVQDHFSDF